MKFQRLLLCILLSAISINAIAAVPDPATKKLIQDYLKQKQNEWKLTDKDISNWTISNFYSNESSKTTYIYIHQQINGIKIFNAVSSVSIKDGQIKSFAKRM